MKKIILLILTVVIFCSVLTLVSASAVRSYGADNLNDKPGDLVVGFIGGSITQGYQRNTRWSYHVVNDYFKKNYPNKNVVERNVAIAGTPSAYGMIRIRRALELDSASTPDVVFIEFAVNDEWSTNKNTIQNMESMVRQLLAMPKIPSIIFVYTTERGSDGKMAEFLPERISAMHEVAENYGIYEINLNDYIWNGTYDNGDKIDWSKLSNDGTHPNDEGHKVYSKYICKKLTEDKTSAFARHDPKTSPCGEYVYGKIREIPLSDSSVKLSSGWKHRPNGGSTTYIDSFFEEGIYETENCVGETVELEFLGTGFGIDMSRTKNNGTVNWELFDESGNSVKDGSYTCYYKTDTGRPYGKMLVSGLSYEKYKLVITGSKYQKAEDNGYGTGTYLGIAYIAIETPYPEDGLDYILTSTSVSYDEDNKTFSSVVTNNTTFDKKVVLAVADYEEENGIKKMTGIKTLSKTVRPNVSESFTLSADKSLNTGVFLYDGSALSPVKKYSLLSYIQYLGVGKDNEAIYKLITE